jgi:hypothetical protein
MVVKWSNSVDIRINPLNGAVVIACPSPSEFMSYRRANKRPEVRQKIKSRHCPTMTT